MFRVVIDNVRRRITTIRDGSNAGRFFVLQQQQQQRGIFAAASSTMTLSSVLPFSNSINSNNSPLANARFTPTLQPHCLPCTIQIRSFAKKKKNKGGGGGNNNNNNNIKVYMVWDGGDNEEDFESAEEFEDPTIIPGNIGNLDTFKSTVYRKLEMDDDDDDAGFQIFNSKSRTYEPLTDMQQIKIEQQVAGKVFLAPEENVYEDDYDNEEEGDYNFADDYNEDATDDLMREFVDWKAIVQDVARELQKLGWNRHHNTKDNNNNNNNTLIKTATGEIVPTKEAILGIVMDDEKLQILVLQHIGALDHIATAVHFDFVWNNVMSADTEEEHDDIDDSMQEAQFVQKEET